MDLPCAVTNQTVPLHLPESQAAVPGPALCGLPCKHGAWTLGTGMHLVQHHVLQLLVVDGPKEDVGTQRFSEENRK